MDSFYDQPRRAPMPKTLSKTTEKILPNLVPEVSMLVHNKGNFPQKRNEMSYNAWKYQMKNDTNRNRRMEKENSPILSSTTNATHTQMPSGPFSGPSATAASLLRKQVRFETPQPAHKMPGSQNLMPRNVMLPLRPALINNSNRPPFNSEKTELMLPRRQETNILQAKPFDKMYIANANIPNRHLDLSVIEPPRQLPHIHRAHSFPETCTERNEAFNGHPVDLIDHPQTNYNKEILRTEKQCEKHDADEPTVKDLLKIIQQQNEQLMCLQKQVTTLLVDREHNYRQIEAPPPLTPTLEQQEQVFPAFKNGKTLPNKFAIDVMTSFEVSIRNPESRFNMNKNKYDKRFYCGGNEPKITEIFDESMKNASLKPTDLSVNFKDDVVVGAERPQSPENSIHVDMKDFSSDDEDEQETNENSMLGWTIYNNVMDQVNCMLMKQTDNSDKRPGAGNGAIMKQVKEATLNHLKNVGIDLNLDDEITISTDSDYTPSQVSFAVKQLLMKYLPDEQLAHIAKDQLPMQKPNYHKNLIKRRPDFSLATVQYMEKYNLLNSSPSHSPRSTNLNMARSDKMLDITALKQQPKLL